MINLDFFLFADHLLDSLLDSFTSVSYLTVICAQSWGYTEAFYYPSPVPDAG